MKNKLSIALIIVALLSALIGAFGLVKLSQSPDKMESFITVDAPSNKIIDKKLAGIAGIIKRESKLHIDTAYQYARFIINSAEHHNISPTLILAIISIESNFNTNAYSYGSIGLMQVVASIHKIKPAEKLYDPEYNIKVGSKILKSSIKRGGGIIQGLGLYNGSFHINDAYSDKVLNKKAKYDKLIYT